MTLDESNDGLEKLDSNGITAYIDAKLLAELNRVGDINVDFITNEAGQSGYSVRIGDPGAGCAGCGSSESCS